MQDIHRFDRRLRPHGHHQAALKCPRCDSLNTKFCYYNNYNLSQPRHFCKSCRRYWTKGGVLRNVPVGGGCRKSKRSKPKSGRKSNQSSSSDSSTLTATALPAEEAAAPVEDGAVPDQSITNSNSATVYEFPAPSRFFNHPVMDQVESNGDRQIFGSFTSLMTSPEEMLGFGMGNRGSDMGGTISGTVEEFKGGCEEEGLAAVLDWGDGGVGGGSGGDEGLFDLTGGVDPWSQTQWTDNDQFP